MPLSASLRDWLTVPFDRLVLVVARTVTALNRLLDIVSLIHEDTRVQVVFTADPAGRAVFRRGTHEMLESLGVAAIDWAEATAVDFDLVLAASENDRLHLLRGPILLVPHGFGYQKYYPNGTTVAGMNPARLVRGHRVIPTVIGVSHHTQMTELARACPAAAGHAVVIGDPALDRMSASRHRVHTYREALGGRGRTVVLLTSTWGPDSLLGRRPDLPQVLAAALPVDEYRLLTVLHPGVWAAHSRWQVEAWLTRAQESGVRVVGPRYWQAAMLACDAAVSDHSSLALYAAAQRKPLLLTPEEAGHTVAGSPLAELAAAADRLDPDTDLGVQIEKLLTSTPSPAQQHAVERGVSEIGRSAQAVRRVLYDLLRLRDPDPDADYPPAPRPDPSTARWTSLVASLTEHGDMLRVRRVPAMRRGFPAEGGDFRHLVVNLETASLREVAAATVICCEDGPATRIMFAEKVAGWLGQWPDARLIVARDPQGEGCLIGYADGKLAVRVSEPPEGFDPTALASVIYARLVRGRPPVGAGRLLFGDRVVTFLVESY